MDSPRGVEQILGALPQTLDLSAPVPAREQPWELGAIRDQTLTLTSALGWGDDPRSHPRPPPAQPQPQGSPSLQAGDGSGEAQGGGRHGQHSAFLPQGLGMGEKAGEQQWRNRMGRGGEKCTLELAKNR